MEKFGRSQPITRVEDQRFLTGAGRYVDDIAPEGAFHAVFLRSSMGHADITQMDVTEAAAMPGVVAIITADTLAADGVQLGMKASLVANRDGSKGAAPMRPLLAMGRVRHVGEPIACIICETREAGKDAAEAIEIDFDDLEAHVATALGGFEIHAEAPNNQAFDYGKGDEAGFEAALAGAAHVVKIDVPDNRVFAAPMEPRGCYAEFEDGRIHVAVNGQGVWGPKADMAYHLGMDKADVRVTNPDVGGGFGMKGMAHPETPVVAHAARKLGKPVRWMSERSEGMMTDTAGRDLITTATLAFDAHFKIVGYHLDTISNIGAYNSQFAQFIQTDLFSKVLMGTYDVQAAYMRCRGVYTNTTPVDAYRGAGRPEAIFILERMMDEAARQLGVDAWDLRKRNFIRPDQFPYTTASGVTYDVGEFAALLDVANDAAEVGSFAERRAASAKAGKLRGQGLCYYIESILGAPTETSRIEFTDDGALIYVGTQSNGQGHETVYAQFLADQTGIPAEKIAVVQGDSDLIPTGGGTGGSRSVTVQNTATLATVEVITQAFTAFLSDAEGVPAAQISFDDERFRIPGSNLTPTMLEVADLARAADRADLLDHTATITLENRSFPNGAHVAEVEIDPETGVLEVVRYTVVDDFGNLINPMLVAGQIHGGVVQGIGQAVTEQVSFDASGQLLSATFMDYGMPRADNVPDIAFSTRGTPSKYNPMGMKGCGEAGTVGALAAVTNAAVDAMWDSGVRDASMPFTPHRVWDMLQRAKRGGDVAA